MKKKIEKIKQIEEIDPYKTLNYTDTYLDVKKELETLIEQHEQRIKQHQSKIDEKEEETKEPEIDKQIERKSKEKGKPKKIDKVEYSKKLNEMLKKFELKPESIVKNNEIIGKSSQSESIESKILRRKPSKMKFKDPMQVLYDTNVRAELETLFPGYIDLLMSKQVYLTARTKHKRIKMAEMCIRNMPRYMKEKYQRLLHIVIYIFTLIPETKHSNVEDLKFSNLIEDLFFIDEDYSSEEEIPFPLLFVDPDEVKMEFSFD